MKKLFFIIPVILIVGLTVCLKPIRDNEYDPNNPHKVTLRGYVYGLNEQPMPNVEVSLIQDTEVTDTAISGTDGAYAIIDFDPGIYKLVAQAPHYVPFECEPESFPAYADDTIDIWFCSQRYGFEEETPGTVQPFGFDTVCGIWRVVYDSSGSEYHSAPNVYHGENTAAGFAVSLLKNSAPSFHLETMFKVSSASLPGWVTGALFRYDNNLNFYFVGITTAGIALQKRINGVDTTLLFQPHVFQVDQWYDLTVQMCGTDISIWSNGVNLNFSDSTLVTGKAGLWVSNINVAHLTAVNFDDVVMGR
jgi:hypothetical protein